MSRGNASSLVRPHCQLILGVRRHYFAAVLSVFTLPAISGSAASLDELNALAHSGRIQQDAPVKAEVQMRIAASSRGVVASHQCAVLAEVEPSNSEGRVFGAPRLERSLYLEHGWNHNPLTVQLLEAERRLAWTGTALTAKAVHVWELSVEQNGQTEVTVRESMEGLFIKHLFPSEKLTETDTDWLVSLKHSAEAQLQ